ncbi:hypothetical protein L1887_21758 [Cichorium endivia]|nr:hypothetical protein L1887_21758 [Cichorium endivia]
MIFAKFTRFLLHNLPCGHCSFFPLSSTEEHILSFYTSTSVPRRFHLFLLIELDQATTITLDSKIFTSSILEAHHGF